MYKIGTLLFFVFANFMLFGQNTGGSLDDDFQKSHDKGEALLLEDPVAALKIGEEMMKKASLISNHKWQSSAYYLIGRAQVKQGLIEDAEKTYLEAIRYEKTFDPIDTAKLAWVYHNVGNFYKKIASYTEAFGFFQKSLILEKALGSVENQTSCLLNMGAMLQNMGHADSALVFYENGLVLAKETNDSSTVNSLLSNMALVYEVKGDYQKALKTVDESMVYSDGSDFDKAYAYSSKGNIHYYMGQIDSTIYYYELTSEAFKRSGSELESAMMDLNLGVIFSDEEAYERAELMYQSAIVVFEKYQNPSLLSTAHINYAGIFDKRGEVDKALDMYLLALQESQACDNQNNIAAAYQNIGTMYERKEDFQKALQYTEKSLGIFQNMGDVKLMADTHAKLGSLANKTKRWSYGLGHLKKAEELANGLGSPELLLSIYTSFIEHYAGSTGNSELIDYYIKEKALTDSINKAQNHLVVQDLIKRYELEEKADSIAMQDAEILTQKALTEKANTVSEQKSQLLWITAIGGIAVAILAFIAFINFKRVRVKNRQNELLLGEIHHRVKNNLQVVSSLLSLQEKNITDDNAKTAIQEGKERVKSMGLIHKMLYQNDNFSGIEMNLYVKDLLTQLRDAFGKQDQVEVEVGFKALKLDVDTAVPMGLIINELAINAFKYAFDKTENPKLSVELMETNDGLLLEVADNGNGSAEEVQASSSFGTKLIRSLTRQLRGSLEVADQSGLKYSILFKDYKVLR